MNLIRFKSPSSVNSTLDRTQKNTNTSEQIDEKILKPSKIKPRSSRKTIPKPVSTVTSCTNQNNDINKEQKAQDDDENVWILRDNFKTNIPIPASRIQTKKGKCVHYAPSLTQG
jgi:hypothetical protein